MNLIELMNLNNYGRTREVLFTSLLSYLLNPQNDHGLGDIFLKELLKKQGIEPTKEIKVIPEKNLGKSDGNIDIYIETEKNIVGIEAKIWDDSAINNSKNNEEQLKRYCESLKALSTKEKKGWTLVFLIPYKDAPKCIEEFDKVKEDNSEHIKLLVWRKDEGEKYSENENYYIKNSIYEIIENIITNPLIDIQDRTSWLLKSLIESIPKYVDEEKSESRFPTKEDLKNLPNNWWKNLMEPFCDTLNRNVNSVHTTIGFPYGRENEKATHPNYKNTLFRIRTTKKYYSKVEDKEKYYPDALEIEIWEKVYEIIKEDLENWLKNPEISEYLFKKSKHIEEKPKEEIMLLQIKKGKINSTQVKDFEIIMKKGFKKLLEKTL
jgi:hypothetical protein